MEINISLSGDFVSELHSHTMIPSTPNASCCWGQTLLPTLQKVWMKNSVDWTKVTPHEPLGLEACEILTESTSKVETQSSWNQRLVSVWTALIQSSALIQTSWLQPEETREDRKKGREGYTEEKRDFPTSHWDPFSGCSLHLPCCPFIEEWEGLITRVLFLWSPCTAEQHFLNLIMNPVSMNYEEGIERADFYFLYLFLF